MFRFASQFDAWFVRFAKRYFVTFARIAFCLIFFYFGFLKLVGLSPASPLAQVLTERTIGAQYFDVAFMILAAVECLIGVLFLLPKYTKLATYLLLIHMVIVCSPLLLVPDHAWSGFPVPTLEGQYIIKNAALVALAFGVVAQSSPRKRT
jgi:uncharacterized membrane protein YkgB